MTLSQQSFHTKPHVELQRDFAAYRSFLPLLASTATVTSSDTTEAALFHRVLADAGKRPDLMDELIERYGRWQGEGVVQPQVTRPPELLAAHLTETYRTAWEALLLAPPSDEIEFMQRRFAITQALSKIGNPASIPVLELAFRSTIQEGVRAGEGSGALERQFRILESLNQFTSKEALQAMLRCVGRAEAKAEGRLPKYSGYDLREWVGRFLTDKDNYKTKEKWREVLRDFPKANFPVKDRELLEKVVSQE
jgi:hypothetical protein